MQKLTKKQAIVITGYTGILAGNVFGDFHADLEKRLGRPVWTHEMPHLKETISDLYKDDFLSMCWSENE